MITHRYRTVAASRPGMAAGIGVALVTDSTALGRHPGRLTKTSKAPLHHGREAPLPPGTPCTRQYVRTGLRPAQAPCLCTTVALLDCREEVFRLTRDTHPPVDRDTNLETVGVDVRAFAPTHGSKLLHS